MTIHLGSGQTGLTLTARLFDIVTDIQVGSDITSRFTESGGGDYDLDTSMIPDDFLGRIRFYSGATYMAMATISPEDCELIGNLDATVSSRSTLTAAEVDTQLSSTHGPDIWDAQAAASVDPWSIDVVGPYTGQQAGAILAALLNAESVGFVTPTVSSTGDVELTKGSDYLVQDGLEIVFTDPGSWPVLGNANITFVGLGTELDMRTLVGSTQQVGLSLEDTDTADLPLNRYRFAIKAQLTSGDTIVLVRGRIIFV